MSSDHTRFSSKLRFLRKGMPILCSGTKCEVQLKQSHLHARTGRKTKCQSLKPKARSASGDSYPGDWWPEIRIADRWIINGQVAIRVHRRDTGYRIRPRYEYGTTNGRETLLDNESQEWARPAFLKVQGPFAATVSLARKRGRVHSVCCAAVCRTSRRTS